MPSRLQRWWSERRAPIPAPSPAPAAAATPGLPPLRLEELDEAAAVLQQHNTRPGGPWDNYRNRYLALPDDFDLALDPRSPAYVAQQQRLWQLVSGRSDYAARTDEQTPEVETHDALYRPAFYDLRAPGTMAIGGGHIMATGHFLMHSGVKARDRVLEYGAGYGQTALAFARMGARVFTVDVNPHFCAAVQAQAEHFKVKVQSFTGEFGDNPKPWLRYELIFFYEAFHHCRDFLTVIPKLREMLTPGGKILLGGEPITTVAQDPSIPYPWGLRLDAENCAVVRRRGWYELGFQEDFLVRCFQHEGFVWQKHVCEATPLATLHAFTVREPVVPLGQMGLAGKDAEGWHAAEATGRWTRAEATLPLDTRNPALMPTLNAINHHPTPLDVRFAIGGDTVTHRFAPRERRAVPLPPIAGDTLTIHCEPRSPASYGSPDTRLLGLFVEQLDYGDVPAAPLS